MGTTEKLLNTLLVAAVVSGCGGGSGSSGASADSSDLFTVQATTTYTSAATVGELVSYTVNPNDLTYSYEITASAFGKLGQTGSGTLVKNADGSYTPSGMNGKIRLNENGTMVGAISQDFDGDGTPEVVPVFGVSNPVTSAAEAAGIYNYVSLNRDGQNASYGTLDVKADGTWRSCSSHDLRTGTNSCTDIQVGTFNVLQSGRVQVLDAGGNSLGTLVTHLDTSKNQKVMFLDVAHNVQGGFGNGILIGSEIASTDGSSVEGTWIYMNSQTGPGKLVVGASSYTDSAVGSTPIPYTLNSPWVGMGTTGNGFKVLMAGTGMFAAAFETNSVKQISLGIRVGP